MLKSPAITTPSFLSFSFANGESNIKRDNELMAKENKEKASYLEAFQMGNYYYFIIHVYTTKVTITLFNYSVNKRISLLIFLLCGIIYMIIYMGVEFMSKNFSSKKIFNDEYKRVKERGIQETINVVKSRIAKHYEENLCFDYLLQRLETLEYIDKQQYNFVSNLLVGLFAGIIGALYMDMMQRADNQENFWARIILIIIAVIILLAFIFFIIRQLDSVLSKLFTNKYTLYIIPFEKQLVIEKLKKEFKFDYK